MKKTFLFFVMVLIGFWGNAQILLTTLTFSGKDTNNNYVRLDSVVITNHTKSWQETIYYQDTILIMGGTGIEEYEPNPRFALLQNIPNPFNGVSDFSLQLPEDNAVTIFVFDLNGKKITELQQTLSSGIHAFRVSLSTPQTYLLSVNSGTDHASIKIINTGNAGKNRIECLFGENEMPITYQSKSAKGETENPFDLGDSMEYVGYATNNGAEIESEVIRQMQIGSESFELVFATLVGDGQPCPGTQILTDADGNTYNTVQIGTQCWMRENLRVTKYAIGTAIPLGTSTSINTPYRYNPNNNSSNVSTYGYLYNWAAVMGGSGSSSTNPSGVQGICPTGWHVPSDAEWTQLTDYVSSRSQYLCGNDSTSIAKALASTIGWDSFSSTCAVGNTPSTNNTTGFSILPAGSCYGSYSIFGYIAYFWSTSLYGDFRAYSCSLYYGYYSVNHSNGSQIYGYSVRCIRD
jgi:uncharacterized protein (TIGR02145 family)